MTAAALLKKKKKVKRLLKAVIKHNGNQTAAARELGIKQQTLNKQIHDPEVEKSFREIIDKAGLTDEFQAKVLFDGHNAMYMKSPDYGTRHRYLETGLKLKGHLKADMQAAVQVNVAAFMVPEKKALPQ